MRLMAADILAQAGFEVLQATNANEALRVLGAGPRVQAVFCDIELPGSLNGFELTQHIHERWPGLGIVLTSGHSLYKGLMPEGTFLAKPYAGPDLVRKIEEVILGA